MAKAKTTTKEKKATADQTLRVLPHILLRPRITEKASDKSVNDNVYIFEVNPRATKREITKSVIDFYKVTPVKIAIVPIPRKKVLVRGKFGMTSGGKKAYVYLKKGDKIEFV